MGKIQGKSSADDMFKKPLATELAWLDVALDEVGQTEIAGSKDNPRIEAYHATTTLKATDDETPWCSSFVNWVFKQLNYKRTNSAAAKSWLDWGIKIEKPIRGCVVILSRDGGNHVTFWMKQDGAGFIGFGGNQNNRVGNNWYANGRVLGYRWPSEAKDLLEPETAKTPSDNMIALAWKKPTWDKHIRAEFTKSECPDIIPTDIAEWCPKYAQLSRPERVEFWCVLAVAICYRESGYNPDASMVESNGDVSEGLFQMTYGNYGCPKSKKDGDLRDPFINITGAVKNFEKWVKLDKVVSQGGYVKYGAAPAKGIARYWSVARDRDSKSKHHKAEIQAKTLALFA